MVKNLLEIHFKKRNMKKYKKDDIDIIWNSEKCTHSGFCARQLSAVFKPKERPWIQPEHASRNEIIKQVNKCPSRAFSIELND